MTSESEILFDNEIPTFSKNAQGQSAINGLTGNIYDQYEYLSELSIGTYYVNMNKIDILRNHLAFELQIRIEISSKTVLAFLQNMLSSYSTPYCSSNGIHVTYVLQPGMGIEKISCYLGSSRSKDRVVVVHCTPLSATQPANSILRFATSLAKLGKANPLSSENLGVNRNEYEDSVRNLICKIYSSFKSEGFLFEDPHLSHSTPTCIGNDKLQDGKGTPSLIDLAFIRDLQVRLHFLYTLHRVICFPLT